MSATNHWRVIYISEVDLSVDDGPGINEREFVRVCLEERPDSIRYIVPEPARPNGFSHPAIEYVRPHRDSPLIYPLHLWAAYKRARKIIDRERVDALVFRIGASPLLPALLARTTKLPVLFKTLSLSPVFGGASTRGAVKNGLSRLFFPMYRSVLSNALASDTVSATYAAWLSERFDIDADRITLIPNGANAELFRPTDPVAARDRLGLSRFDALIGYVGAMTRLRHVDALLRAFARADLPQSVGLLLVGSGAERAELETLSRELGLEQRVVFTGSVPYSKVPDYVACLDAAIDVTALELTVAGSIQRSSFSQKIPQYLLAGVPVVAWACEGTEFLEAEKVGVRAQFGDEEDLAKALEEVLEPEPTDAAKRRQRCRQLAENHFSAGAVADLRVAWWNTLLSKSGDRLAG